MGVALGVEGAFFPLDEELGLAHVALTPWAHRSLLLLSAWMPFAVAAHQLELLSGISISRESARRVSEEGGANLESWQNEQAKPEQRANTDEVPARLVMATDGAMVPLLKGEWGEVKTVAVGKLKERKKGQGAQYSDISYFSRLADSQTFGDLASYEIRRRGVDRCLHVAAVQDGADWIQGFIQGHRQDALRILDFPHAAQYVSELGHLASEAGTLLPKDWLENILHELKEEGASSVLCKLQALCGSQASSLMREKLAYLSKRETLMHYPEYQAAGWPIGSGMVESANKLVVEARLKGSGMHWHRRNVNPMLALRTTVCSDRWKEGWKVVQTGEHQRRNERKRMRREASFARAQDRFLHILFSFPLHLLLDFFSSPPLSPKVKPKGRTESQKRWGRQTFSRRVLQEGSSAKK